ncbi:DUF1329 domain-containing protein [Rhodoferax lacus]|uniref:DUF1329 domain-containing protein n=1 Tax=Rhodoferax lacus TaxID=2184758 RepID=A0A3E1R9G2_9BURK|nr:DUF1329 domain-containing protein [Rhodoferax lacus]RFO96009.1 DUF1329 domain-containing protein [Rhodoferax lacus]
MNKRMGTTATAAMAIGLVLSGAAWAKVPAAEADKLGKELTCVGAEKAANKDGSIPEFSGKWLGTPPGLTYTKSVGQHPVDPYANEKPLYSITADNMAQHAAKLSDGQKALFAKFPKTFRMDVYPGHRDFRYPDYVCDASRKNALNAEISDGGLGIKGAFKGAIPFPLPKDGNEALANNTFPYRAFNEDTVRDMANVQSSGSIAWGRTRILNLNVVNGSSIIGQPLEGAMSYNRSTILLPERDKGGVSVSEEPVNFAKGKRLAWSYDPGTRRVRQVPEYGFDQPMAGTGGKMTIDSDSLFNGSPERYNWKLLGKREMFVPANSYKLHSNTVKYADLLKPGTPNPDFIRWELRRVWAVEGTLKEGFRHLYGKRVMFLDEDTWKAAMSDFYDARGSLWQYGFINHYYAFDLEGWHPGSAFYHDLNSGGYVGYNLFQERDKGPVLNKGDLKPAMFTPEAARSAGN